MKHRKTVSRGFTLVEILIVVIILGILATIVLAQFSTSSDDSRRTVFVNNLRTFLKAEGVYREATGQYLEDASSGECPAGFENYIDDRDWENGTPVGGVWDAEYDESGIISAIGVHFMSVAPRDDDYMQKIDLLVDDGDLNTGRFRKFASDRFYFVIDE